MDAENVHIMQSLSQEEEGVILMLTCYYSGLIYHLHDEFRTIKTRG